MSNSDSIPSFLFGLYSNESGTYILKEEFQKYLQVCESSYIPDSIGALFNERGKDRVTLEEFGEWLRDYPDATSLSRWLLCEPCAVTISNELETPTFYQTLAGVTHLEERDIIELEKRYWVLKGESRTGKLDLETLRPLISPPVPLSVCTGVFAAFDENRDNHIDFKEMACGISAATRGPMAERQKFCFKVFDLDRDGLLSESEMDHMVDVLLHLHHENSPDTALYFYVPVFFFYYEAANCHALKPQEPSFSNSSICCKSLRCDGGTTEDKKEVLAELKCRASPKGLTIEEYLIWSMDNLLSTDFLCLLFQVCHVVLGLRPVSNKEEGEIVRGWLEREERRGYSVGQFWYLIAMDWWQSWLEYVGFPPNGCGSETSLNNLTSTESGSLKRVAQRLTGSKRTIVENCVALDNSPVSVEGAGLTGALNCSMLQLFKYYTWDLAHETENDTRTKFHSPVRIIFKKIIDYVTIVKFNLVILCTEDFGTPVSSSTFLSDFGLPREQSIEAHTSTSLSSFDPLEYFFYDTSSSSQKIFPLVIVGLVGGSTP
ncbi:Ubiquitin carboxyl-terminal hydrolase 32 [Homalodisca vitripennis]|nr:Ubiquitin carboxyl-terminal hydrolase 32 [Homalodisca vitripennis]